MDENRLTDDEAKFCLLFVNGSDKVAGNARKCYQAIYPEVDDAVAQMKAREILAKESAKERIKELRSVELYSADSLRPALTEKLMKIADECSDSLYISTKTGLPANPAAMRSVAVSAIKTLSDMYGIKEDVAHHISIGGELIDVNQRQLEDIISIQLGFNYQNKSSTLYFIKRDPTDPVFRFSNVMKLLKTYLRKIGVYKEVR